MIALALTLTLASQPRPASHAPIPPSDPGVAPEELLLRRLSEIRNARANDQLQKLLRDLQRNPDAAAFDRLRNDPAIRRAVEQFQRDNPDFAERLANNPDGRPSAEMIPELEKLARQILDAQAKSAQPSRLSPDLFRPLNTPASTDLERAVSEKFADWVRSVETSDTLASLRESPAFRQALQEFAKLAAKPGTPNPSSPGGRLGSWLGSTDGLAAWVRSLDLSKLPSPGNVRLPAVKLPEFPAQPRGFELPIPSAGGLGSLLFSAVAAAVVVAVIWSLPKWSGVAAKAEPPDPIDPAAVDSRESFVRTFEAIIVRRFGPPARHWHHRKIGRRIAGEPSAAELVRRYELARYAPPAEWPRDWAAARPALAALAASGE